MATPNEQQPPGPGEPAGGDTLEPQPGTGQPQSPDSLGSPTDQPQQPDAQPGGEPRVPPTTTDTDLSKLSREKRMELVQDPDAVDSLIAGNLRQRDYTQKAQEIADERRRLEQERTDFEAEKSALETAHPTVPSQQPPSTGDATDAFRQMQQADPGAAQAIMDRFVQQYPEGGYEQFVPFLTRELTGMMQQGISKGIEDAMEPVHAQMAEAEIRRIDSELDNDYSKVVEEFPHAGEPGVRDALRAEIRHWKPDRYDAGLMRKAYLALYAGRYMAQGQQPASPQSQAQPLPPATRKGTPAAPKYDSDEDMIEAMLKETQLAAKLDFPDSTGIAAS